MCACSEFVCVITITDKLGAAAAGGPSNQAGQQSGVFACVVAYYKN